MFFEIASKIAEAKGEKAKFISNETFEAAYNESLKTM